MRQVEKTGVKLFRRVFRLTDPVEKLEFFKYIFRLDPPIGKLSRKQLNRKSPFLTVLESSIWLQAKTAVFDLQIRLCI